MDTCFALSTSITSEEIKNLRKKLNLTQYELAAFFNVSYKTVQAWEIKKEPIKGSVVSMIKFLTLHPDLVSKLRVPPLQDSLRIWYMNQNDICTIMDVNERERKVTVHNYVNDVMFCAFGPIETPSYELYEEFLKSRCFPETRDKIKLELKALDIPFYEPIMIIEKTEGRMAEDNFWLRVERKKDNYDRAITM